MRRLPGWPQRLHEYLESVKNTPFSYGPNGIDCTRLAAGAIRAITGTDVISDLPKWSDEMSARAVIAGLGRSLPEAVDAVLAPHGAHRCPPQLAGRGDIALVETGTLGVHMGHAIVALGDAGLTWLLPSDALITWKI